MSWHDDDEGDDPQAISLNDRALTLPAPTYEVSAPPARHRTLKEDDARVLFTPEVRAMYLEQLARTGRKYLAAQLAGTTCRTVARHAKVDPELMEEIEEAMEAYRDTVRATVQRRALEGDLEPIIGRVGKDRDGIIAYKRRFSDTILLAEAKRVDPEYRDKSTVDMNVKAAGVLVVGTMMSAGEWAAQFGGQQLPTDPLAGLPGVTEDMLSKADD